MQKSSTEVTLFGRGEGEGGGGGELENDLRRRMHIHDGGRMKQMTINRLTAMTSPHPKRT